MGNDTSTDWRLVRRMSGRCVGPRTKPRVFAQTKVVYTELVESPCRAGIVGGVGASPAPDPEPLPHIDPSIENLRLAAIDYEMFRNGFSRAPLRKACPHTSARF